MSLSGHDIAVAYINYLISLFSPLLLLYAVDQDVVLNYIVPALWLPVAAVIPTMIAMDLSSETLSPQ